MSTGISYEEIITRLGLGILGFLAAVIVGIALERSMSKQCGDFTGNWYATGVGGVEAPEGVFRLRSEGCRVSGELETGSQFVSLVGAAERTRMTPRRARIEGLTRDHRSGAVEAMAGEMTLVHSGRQILFEITPEGEASDAPVQFLLTEMRAAGRSAAQASRTAAP